MKTLWFSAFSAHLVIYLCLNKAGIFFTLASSSYPYLASRIFLFFAFILYACIFIFTVSISNSLSIQIVKYLLHEQSNVLPAGFISPSYLIYIYISHQTTKLHYYKCCHFSILSNSTCNKRRAGKDKDLAPTTGSASGRKR